MLRIIALLIGLGLLAFIALQTDLTQVWQGLLQLGLAGALAVCAVYFLAFVLDTASWQLTLPSARLNLAWLYRLWKLRMLGEALNLVLPAGSMGGEPVKAVLLKKSFEIGYHEGTASVIMARTINLISLLVFAGAGFVLMLERDWMPRPLLLAMGIGWAALALGVMGFYIVQRWRAASRLGVWLARGRFGRPIGRALVHLEQVDDHFVAFYLRQPGRFAGALILALVNWMVGAFEVYAIMWFLAQPISFADAWLIEAAAQLVRAGAFFIPASLGAVEGVMVLVYAAMTGSGALGLAVALIRRGRELLWVAWGFWLGWLNTPGGLAAMRESTAPGPPAGRE